MKNVIIRHIFIALLIILSIPYFNCGDDTVTNTPAQTSISCITGQISNWTYGNTKILNAKIYSKTNHIYTIASCPIDIQGNFNLCLPASLPDTTMFRADSVFYSNCPGNTSVNPPDTRGAEIWIMEVYEGQTLFAQLQKSNYNLTPSAGSFAAMFIYVNKNLSITGNKYCGNDTLQFNGNAVTGWNQIIRNYIKVTVNGNTILYNNTEPTGGLWKLLQ